MKRYKITLPTKEQCTAFGLKFEGQDIRTQLWLMGVASGVNFCSIRTAFNVTFTNRLYFYVETNSQRLIAQVEEYLGNYGCKVELV